MLRAPDRWHSSIESRSDQPFTAKETQQTPNGSRRILAAHQGELLRPAADKISNLRGSEVSPVDWLIRKNTDQQSPCFPSIMLARSLRAAALSFQMPIEVGQHFLD
jgi:hypothetical protein